MKSLLVSFVSLAWLCATGQAQTSRPNILVIMTDDQSHDTLTSEFMPNTKAMIADQGASCSQFIMPTSLCCPSRASFLTGKYAHHNGVQTNEDQLVGPTLANHLHDAGYYTGLIGKYLNSWPGNARPEYDYWAAWIRDYIDPKMNIFGSFVNVRGYLTYIQRDYARDFLDKVPAGKPFFLLFTPHAPHLPATPAPGDQHLYSDIPQWRPSSFNSVDQSDKPDWLAKLPRLSAGEVYREVDNLRVAQLQCLHSVDIAVRDILLRLQEQGKLDNTFIVFYSDNGFLWGEHRLIRKNRVYEEASHGPCAFRFPPLIPGPRNIDNLVGVIDLAPTIYELAGIPIPADVDGHSLVPLMRGKSEWRDAILLEGWPASASPDDKREIASLLTPGHSSHGIGPLKFQDYKAIRTKGFVYIETVGDKPELYDLKNDPYQIHNLVGQADYSDLINQLRFRLHHEKL